MKSEVKYKLYKNEHIYRILALGENSFLLDMFYYSFSHFNLLLKFN